MKHTNSLKPIDYDYKEFANGEIYRDNFLSVYETSIVEGQSKPRKTKIFNVHSICSKSRLGQIRWYSSWRHYCFFPTMEYGTIYSDRCLGMISKILIQLNNQHKNKKEDDGLHPTDEDVHPSIL